LRVESAAFFSVDPEKRNEGFKKKTYPILVHART